MVDEATGDGAQVDAVELALLQRMGLPTAFSTTKARACKSQAQLLERILSNIDSSFGVMHAAGLYVRPHVCLHQCYQVRLDPMCLQGQASEDDHEQLHTGLQEAAGSDADWHQSFDPERQRYYYWRLSPRVDVNDTLSQCTLR